MDFDVRIFEFIHGLAGRSDALDIFGIFLAKYLGYFLILIVIGMIFIDKSSRARLYKLFFLTFTLLVSFGFIKGVMNFLWYRPRPFIEFSFEPLVTGIASSSFPSGHATIYFTLAMFVYLIVSQAWGKWFFFFAFLIGVGRVFVGVHYPVDVLAGIGIGILVPFIAKPLFARFAPIKRSLS